ncbi:hypothetical protein MMC18_008783 [Xylographa bjoerkii]|nr:hypothetical protein [Xylographa bjoerkii]
MSNRKGLPPPTAAKKSTKGTRHSSAQLAKSTVDWEKKQLLGKHTRPVDRDTKQDTRTSQKSGPSRAPAAKSTSRDDHGGATGTHLAQGSGESSTILKKTLKNEVAALEPIILYPAEQPQTAKRVVQLDIAGEPANCDALILEEQKEEDGKFTILEATRTSSKRDYVHSHSSDRSRSIPRQMAAQTEVGSEHQALPQEEISARCIESDAFDNEDNRSFSDVKHPVPDLDNQYLRLREIFIASDRGWTTIRISLEEASKYATSRRALSRLELIFYEIMVLIIEYESRTHGYRKLRHFRNHLDQYPLLSAAKKYMLLRDIREYMTNALVHQCIAGYLLLRYCFLQYRCLREQRLQIKWRLRKWPWSTIAANPSPFQKKVTLSPRDSYYLFLYVYHCPTDEGSHTAAMHVRNVNRGLVGTKESFREVRVIWTTVWARFGYTFNENSLSFKRLMESEVMQPGFLMSSLRDYEEICIRRSNHDLLAVLKQNPAIIPGMGPMSKQTAHLRPKQQSLTASYTSLASSTCARNEETTSGLANEQPLATNTSFDICMHAPGKAVTTATSACGCSILVTPPPYSLDPSPKHASSGSSGQTVLGHEDIEIIPDETEVASHTDYQCNAQPLHTPLLYQIPEANLKEAMLSSRSTVPAYWQYSLYENSAGERVKVHYCRSKQTTETIAKLFLDKKVIGFDIEWKPNAQYTDGIRKNVSLIQLASEERIALFHIANFSQGDTLANLLAPTLKAIMEDPKISKVGVSVKSDCTRLRKSMGIKARGLFELSHLYKLIKYSANDAKKIDKKLVALAKQVEEHLQLPLWKGEVRSSDWSQPLNYQQIQYAASDSYAGLQLYDVMEGKRKALKPIPPRPEHAELDLPIRLAKGETIITDDELDASN